MDLLPTDLISYIAEYQDSLCSMVLVNKELSKTSKKELICRRSSLLKSLLCVKLTVMKNNNIFFNRTSFINTGIYKVYSNRVRGKPVEYNHLFIVSDRYQSYINMLNLARVRTDYWRNLRSGDSKGDTFEFCLVNIGQNLIPGYISFERYKFN